MAPSTQRSPQNGVPDHSDRHKARIAIEEDSSSCAEKALYMKEQEAKHPSGPLQGAEETFLSQLCIQDLDEQTKQHPHTQYPLQTIKRPKRPREDKSTPSPASPPYSLSQRPPKRLRTIGESIKEARVDYWVETGTWPPAEELEEAIKQELFQPALARKRPRCTRSNVSIDAASPTPSDELRREARSAPYRYPCYEGNLMVRGSFMSKYRKINRESQELCQRLLTSPQSPPKGTLFDNNLFEKTLASIRGGNDFRVIRDIARLIVPSAEILAICGAKHLEVLRETTSAGWNNAIPFYGPHPQPDYSLGFKREAFTKEQMQKLRPFLEDGIGDLSYFAATYDMYFPFLTSEVKCGASGLDVADRQNAHSQTIASRGLFELFRLVGREGELHNTITGFSFSHNDVDVRIWAHLLVMDGSKPKFYREPIAMVSIQKTAQADNRWIGRTVAMNILDLWVTDHFKLICSAIDMLPTELNSDVS